MTDWAQDAAYSVLVELEKRKGFRHVIDNMDDELVAEIAKSIATIIRNARNSKEEAHE